jgi:hypothetical protein
MGDGGMSAAVVVCRPVADLLVERKRGREWENAGVRRSDSCGDVMKLFWGGRALASVALRTCPGNRR